MEYISLELERINALVNVLVGCNNRTVTMPKALCCDCSSECLHRRRDSTDQIPASTILDGKRELAYRKKI